MPAESESERTRRLQAQFETARGELPPEEEKVEPKPSGEPQPLGEPQAAVAAGVEDIARRIQGMVPTGPIRPSWNPPDYAEDPSSYYGRLYQEAEDAELAASAAQDIPLNERYLPASWDYRTAITGPWGEALPAPVFGYQPRGWLPTGKPDWGGGQGLFADWIGQLRGLWSDLVRPSQPVPEGSEDLVYGPKATEYRDSVARLEEARRNIMQQMPAASGQDIMRLRREAEVIQGQQGALTLSYAVERIMDGWRGLENLEGGGALAVPAKGLTYLARGVTFVIGSGLGLLVEADREFKRRVLGPRLLAADTLIRESTGDQLPEWYDAARRGGGLTAALAPFTMKSYLALTGQFPQARYSELIEHYREMDAGRIAFSAWMEPARLKEFERLVNAGWDPRLVALEIENPGAEAVGEFLYSPLNVVQLLGSQIRAASIVTRNEARSAQFADDALRVAFEDAARAGTGDLARATNVATDAGMAAVREAEQNIGKWAGRHPFFGLTPSGRGLVYGQQAGNHIMGLISDVGSRDPDRILSAIKATAQLGSGNREAFLEGLQALRGLGVPAQKIFSPRGLDTAALLARGFVDEAGEFTGKRIANVLERAGGDPVKLATEIQSMWDDVLKDSFPDIQTQIQHYDEYQRLVREAPGDAPRYLATHPAAARAPNAFERSVSRTHAALQKYIFRPSMGVMRQLYLDTPAYWARNKGSGNFLPMLIDVGPAPAIKALVGWSPAQALRNTSRRLGGVIGEAALRGVGAAGKGSKGWFGFIGRSSRSEASAATFIFDKVTADVMRSATRAYPLEEILRAATPRQKSALRSLLSHFEDVDEAIAAFRSRQGVDMGRSLAFLSPDDISELRELKILDEIQIASRGSATMDDALRGLDDVMARRRAAGALAASEPSVLNLGDDVQRTAAQVVDDVSREVGQEAADGFTRATRANEDSVELFRDYADELEQLATQQVLKDQRRLARSLARPDWEEAGDRNGWSIINGLRQEFAQREDDLVRTTIADGDAFRQRIWRVSELSKKTRNPDQLRALWRSVQDIIGRDAPDDITGKAIRGEIWPEYLRQQRRRYIGLRDDRVEIHRLRAERFAGVAQMDTVTQLGKRAQHAYARARMFDAVNIRNATADARISARTVLESLYSEFETQVAKTKDPQGLERTWEWLRDKIGEWSRRGLRASEIAAGGLDAPTHAALVNIAGSPDKVEELIEFLMKNTPEFPMTRGAGINLLGSREGAFLEWAEQEAGRAPLLTIIEVPPAARRQGTAARMFDEFLDEMRDGGNYDFLTTKQTADGQAFFGAMENQGLIRRIGETAGEAPGFGYVHYEILQKPRVNTWAFQLVAPADETAPTLARWVHETNGVAERAINKVRDGVRQNWGRVEGVPLTPEIERQLDEFVAAAKPRQSIARATAIGAASEARDFALHNYGQTYGFDLVLSGYIYPFQFWHSRTYAKFLSRVVTNPGLVATYGRYRQTLEKLHAGLPEWWRQNINTNELLGLNSDNPMWFNLEQSLSPLYGLTGVDFTDRNRRLDWWSGVMEDLNKFGPTVWTPYQLLTALYYHVQGEDEAAARWAGRLTSTTRTIRDLTALIDPKGLGIEVDPLVRIFGGGIEGYERPRVGRALGSMLDEGRYSEADLLDSGRMQEGPIWDEARARAIHQRAPNLWAVAAPFFLGVGFKMRTPTDVQIDRMYAEMAGLYTRRPDLSTDEYGQAWDALRERYPFMDTVLLSRKGGIARDEAYAWNVLARIPPGLTSELYEAVGLDREDVQRFYDAKGSLADMTETERLRFMAGVLEVGMLLEVPSDSTRREWNSAKDAYSELRTEGERRWGTDIWDRVDVYYSMRSTDPDKANNYLEANPEVEAALDFRSSEVFWTPLLRDYYGGLNQAESYYKGLMYGEIERRLGSGIWDTWDEYFSLKIAGGNTRAYWRAHPELAEYIDIRNAWRETIANALVKFADRFPETRPDLVLRPQAEMTREEILPEDHPFRWDIARWQETVGAPLLRLVLDEDDMPRAAEDRLAEVATELGLGGSESVIIAILAAAGRSP